jgi:hypothetical protein
LKTEKQITISAFWFEDDGWYGRRPRIFVSDENGKPLTYSTKKEAKTHKKLLNKYMKLVKEKKSKDFNIHIKDISEISDYRYCGSGPSYTECHCFVDIAEMQKKVEKAEYYKKQWR